MLTSFDRFFIGTWSQVYYNDHWLIALCHGNFPLTFNRKLVGQCWLRIEGNRQPWIGSETKRLTFVDHRSVISVWLVVIRRTLKAMQLDLWRNTLLHAGIEHLKSCWASRTTQKPVSSLLSQNHWWWILTCCWQLTCGLLVAFLLRCLVESPFSKAETVSQCVYHLDHDLQYTI